MSGVSYEFDPINGNCVTCGAARRDVLRVDGGQWFMTCTADESHPVHVSPMLRGIWNGERAT